MARLTTTSRKGLSSHLRVSGGTIPSKIPVLPADPVLTSPIEKEIVSPKTNTVDRFAGIKIQHKGKQLTVQEFQKANPTKKLSDIPGMSKALKKAAKANIRLNRHRGGLVAKISEDVKKQIETFRGGGKVKRFNREKFAEIGKTVSKEPKFRKNPKIFKPIKKAS